MYFKAFNLNKGFFKAFNVVFLSCCSWCIDGFTASGDHSPYSLLVAIALSDVPGATTQDTLLEPGTTGMDFLDSDSTSRAQFVVYPGSHSKLNDIVRMQARLPYVSLIFGCTYNFFRMYALIYHSYSTEGSGI